MERKLVPLMVNVCADAPAVAEEGESVETVGARLFTVRVKFCVAFGETPFEAVMVMG